jgi:hypothetical protein
MAWSPEKDRLLKASNDPERKAETHPKKGQPSDQALRELGRKAIKGAQR